MAVTNGMGNRAHRFPYFLPDGRHFLFHAGRAAGNQRDLSWRPRLRRDLAADTVWHGGRLPVFGMAPMGARGALVAQRLDLERKALTGDPVTLADSVANAVSVSAAGLVAYRTGANEPASTDVV